MSNLQTISGKLEDGGDTELFVSLNHKKTVFTLSLSLTNITNNLLKIQMIYFSSVTKQRKSVNILPE